ncbi:MAG: Atg14 domain-containing protein [Methanoregula sp.]|jgi:uncharacterized coiled-coil DUF342 family protein|nr:Atg14 domain-containing protein [Methanoregula sp.]
MSETLIIALISLASGIIGALIVGIPIWRKIGSEKRNTDADTAAVLTKIAMELVDPLQEQIDAMKAETQKKITEAACLTVERDELKEQVEELRKEVEALRIEVEALRAENKSLKDVLQKRRKPVVK